MKAPHHAWEGNHMNHIVRLATFAAMVVSAPLATAHAQENSGLQVTEIQFATALENGQAVSPSTSIARSAGRLYAVIRLTNGTGAATHIRVAFERADHEAGGTTGGLQLDVPASRRYRTVARFGTRSPAGRYRVVVYTESGEVIGQAEVELTD
jgi:hypothetical protein